MFLAVGRVGQRLTQPLTAPHVHRLMLCRVQHRYGIPHFPDLPLLEGLTAELATDLLYTRKAQAHLSVANFWRSPDRARYLSANAFLPYVNNELAGATNTTYRDNFLRVDHAYFYGSRDGMCRYRPHTVCRPRHHVRTTSARLAAHTLLMTLCRHVLLRHAAFHRHLVVSTLQSVAALSALMHTRFALRTSHTCSLGHVPLWRRTTCCPWRRALGTCSAVCGPPARQRSAALY